MIIVDASIWIDHLRRPVDRLTKLLADDAVLMHPYVIGEVALGSFANRTAVIATLLELAPAPMASAQDVLDLIEAHRLFSRGIGYVDLHLLASARLVAGIKLWTRDRRLHAAADELGLAAAPA